jgi:RimJ/RimL family protein N-acetyltransferase
MEIVVPERLTGSGVLLRPLRASDAPAYARAFTEDADLGRLLGKEQDPNEADARLRVEEAAERAKVGAGVELAICAASEDAFLGDVLLHSLSWTNRRGELGFWLLPGARGRGLACAAMECMLKWAFDELAIERMEIATIPENGAAIELARRLGFQEEGLLRKRNLERGQLVDLTVFGLLASEWKLQAS